MTIAIHLLWMQALEQAVDDGLVRSIGLSNFNSQQIQDVIDNSRIKPAVHQVKCFKQMQIIHMIDNWSYQGKKYIYITL